MALNGEYELTYDGLFNNKIKVKKYLSRVTRLKIVLAHVPGPLVHGKFCLATEDLSDDGLPHILEHAIFLGSEEYPHKGVLDKVATRCFSNGTNASTDTDVTIYEITTAGQEGFLNIMPIYLEHILFPNLTDAAYLTEVHHVDGEGRDSGTVYSEMQERENSKEDLVDLALRRALYPASQCGYRYNTGGLLQNIRESTNNQKVREFHRDFYRPENMSLLVVGEVDEEEFFRRLAPFEEKIVKKGLSAFFQRPWQTPVEPLLTSSVVQVLFPSDEEDEGEVLVAWRGPNVKDFHELTAYSVILEYLQDSAVSPLYQAFVEVDKPLCSDIEYSVYENLETALSLSFSSVALSDLPLIQPKLVQVLSGVVEEGFDMKRMASVIKNRSIQTFNNLENSPAETLTHDLTVDFLYSSTNTHTQERLNVRATLESLSREEGAFWTSLLSALLSKPSVTVVAKPSSSVAKENEAQEEERVRLRAQQLGTEGLKQKADELKAAIELNERPILEEVLLAVDMPSLSSIRRHTISTFSNHLPSLSRGVLPFDSFAHPAFKHLPLTFHLHHIDTAFVTMHVLMDASELPKHLLPYLSLFNELLFESPVLLPSGELMDYKEVVARLVEETVEYTASVGIEGDRFVAGEFASYVHLSIKVEAEKYREGVKWCGRLLTGVQFTKERLRSVASKCLGDATSGKKDARVVMEQLNLLSVFKKDSPVAATGMLKQLPFLKRLLASKDNTADLENLQEVARALLRRGAMMVDMRADFDLLNASIGTPVGDAAGALAQVWREEFVSRLKEENCSQVLVWPAMRDIHHVADQSSPPTRLLVGLASTDSSYLSLHSPSLNHFTHPDYAALLVLTYYVNMLEGPLWRAIRGNGLAYGFGLNLDINQGLNFRLLGSTNLVEAFKHAQLFMSNLCDGKAQISRSELECARCDCIFELLNLQATPQQAADRSLLCTLRDLPQDFYNTLVEQVSQISAEQLSLAACSHLKALFAFTGSAVVTCPSSQSSLIAKQLDESFKLKFTVYKNIDKVPL